MIAFDKKISFESKRNDIVTVGELLIDMISADYSDNFDCNTYHKSFGGSPSNIAMNVTKLGLNSLVFSAVGNDGFGTFLVNQLNDAGIDTSCVQRVNRSTSMVVVTKSKSTPIPIFYRQADYHLDYTPSLEEALLNSKIVHFSCWPISMLPARHTIERMIETARSHGVLVCFDPNFHPMIWQAGENGVAYVKSILSKVDIVKPSEDDAERLFGKDTHLNQVGKFLELGAKLVIMTLGKNGALISNGTDTIRMDTLATEVVDTTGAGDAFWSGFYAGLVKGYTVRESLRLGMAVSAFKLKHSGAVVNSLDIEEVKGIFRV
ncbi:carbohydrate kinase family protein [Alicyclobacillus dauci]|uniref:Sugar kinase n=1 Tax=Alicyclobacillus dauci TaxID=1475485 RepID=A0ABY6Z2C8_9BACL|nr:sugar kinase [Alicyclobacillus dauci]WAH37054.1 sugar kinase [Alicyclobacillus dauci]